MALFGPRSRAHACVSAGIKVIELSRHLLKIWCHLALRWYGGLDRGGDVICSTGANVDLQPSTLLSAQMGVEVSCVSPRECPAGLNV